MTIQPMTASHLIQQRSPMQENNLLKWKVAHAEGNIGNQEAQKSLRSQQLLVSQIASNGFISRDLQSRLSVSPTELLAIKQSSGKLLGGGRYNPTQQCLPL